MTDRIRPEYNEKLPPEIKYIDPNCGVGKMERIGGIMGRKPKQLRTIETEQPAEIKETYNRPWNIDVAREPSAFNGYVRVVKYRVTVECIKEDKEIYRQRLQKLWEEGDNHHDYQPLQNKAQELGVELTGDFGSKRIRR